MNADKVLQTAAYTCALITLIGALGSLVFAFHDKRFPEEMKLLMTAAFSVLSGLLAAAKVKTDEPGRPPGK